MDHYCVLGNPVEHSRSPWIHARFAEQTGQRLRYGRQLAALGDFAETLRRFRQHGLAESPGGSGRGCNVTVPFKFEAFALTDRPSPAAQLARACNTLWFEADGIHGDNTDGSGLVADIELNLGLPLAGQDVLLLGAGGAAAGVLGALLARAPARLTLSNRTPTRAAALTARYLTLAALSKTELLTQSLSALDRDFSVIINATASSLSGASLTLPAHLIRPGALVYDLMYGALAQPFLTWARAHGGCGSDGLGMLVEQAAASFRIWRGVSPDTAPVLAELRALLPAP